MEKELNLVELLKGTPKGTKLYSPIFGECELEEINVDKICVIVEDGYTKIFYKNGTYDSRGDECLLFPSKDNRDWTIFKVEKEGFKVGDYIKSKKTEEFFRFTSQAEAGIWAKICNPSASCSEVYINENELGKYEKVSKFDPKWLKPFDRALVRDDTDGVWRATLFSHIVKETTRYPYAACLSYYVYCVPFNEETKHLVGTADEEPEFYKID